MTMARDPADLESPPDEIAAKLKHLEFIQGVISRMAMNSFLYKGWAISVAVGLAAFAAVDSRSALLAIAIGSSLLFWGLDGYYLWLEHGFINLYETAAKKSGADVDLSLKIDKSRPFCGWVKTSFRPHLFMFYGVIIVLDVVGIFLVRGGHGS